MGTRFLLGLTILSVSLVFACQSPVGSISHPAPGTIRISFQSSARTVVADWASTIATYSVTLNSNNGYAPLSQTLIPVGGTASFTNVNQGSWNVAVTALNSLGVQVGSGSLLNQSLSNGGSASWTVPINGSQSGTGSFSFNFSFPSSTGIDTVIWQLFQAVTPYAGIGSSQTISTTSTGVVAQSMASGAYRLALTFYRGGAGGTVAGVYSEAVNVWDNVVSDKWLSPNGTLLPSRSFVAGDFNSTDSSLSNLVVTDGGGTPLTLYQNPSSTPGFSSVVTSYQVATSYGSIKFQPVKSIDGQLIQYSTDGGSTWNGNATGVLSPSLTASSILVRVTAPDGQTKTPYVVSVSQPPSMTSFSVNGVMGTIVGTNVSVTLPYGTNVTNLTPYFTLTPGANPDYPKYSGWYAYDFTSPQAINVNSAPFTQVYTVTVAAETASAAKEMTSFTISSAGVAGTIIGTDIYLQTASGTIGAGWVATYATSGASVRVGGVVQNNGVTPNDFNAPVIYTVTAADGSTKNYTVRMITNSAVFPVSPGTLETFTVPANVYWLYIDAAGAQGGNSSTGSLGGYGARVQTATSVTPGETLYISVGRQSGYNGGGLAGINDLSVGSPGSGGGASDVRQGGSALANRIVVAGGGGGAGRGGSAPEGSGGAGGWLGGPGHDANAAAPGNGAGLTAGGTAYPAFNYGGTAGSNGTLGQGGIGGNGASTGYIPTTYTAYGGGGGGGGGYYGGGGASGGINGGGGGGGSSLVPAGATVTDASQSGDGGVTLWWMYPVPVTITFNNAGTALGSMVTPGTLTINTWAGAPITLPDVINSYVPSGSPATYFMGYSLTNGGPVVYGNANSMSAPGANLTLYASWLTSTSAPY